MLNYMIDDAATSSVLMKHRTGEAVAARRTVPPVRKLDGTGLSIASIVDPRFIATGPGAAPMADQFQGTGVVSGAVPGIPPRWRPVRC